MTISHNIWLPINIGNFKEIINTLFSTMNSNTNLTSFLLQAEWYGSEVRVHLVCTWPRYHTQHQKDHNSFNFYLRFLQVATHKYSIVRKTYDYIGLHNSLVEATGMLGKLVVLVALDSDGANRAGALYVSVDARLLGGCWMVWIECPSVGKDGCPSKSWTYSSFTNILGGAMHLKKKTKHIYTFYTLPFPQRLYTNNDSI